MHPSILALVACGSVLGIVLVALIARALGKRKSDPTFQQHPPITTSLRSPSDPDFGNPDKDDIQKTLLALASARGAEIGQGPLKEVRSPYRDSTQIGLSAKVTFLPDAFDNGFDGRFCKAGEKDKIVRLLSIEADEEVKNLLNNGWRFLAVDRVERPRVIAQGTVRVYKSFKPNKVVLTESVNATFRANGKPNLTRSFSADHAEDIVMIAAFSGADNCFPNAPNQDNGIAGPTFSPQALGVGVSWPTINGGIDCMAQFAIEPSVLSRIVTPEGYELASVEVVVRMMLLGPALR